jgi:chromosomal replication initiator protein
LLEIKSKNNSRVIVFRGRLPCIWQSISPTHRLPEIGRQFGGKHHTTVLHSVGKIEELRKTDKDLNRVLNKLTESLGL